MARDFLGSSNTVGFLKVLVINDKITKEAWYVCSRPLQLQQVDFNNWSDIYRYRIWDLPSCM